MRALVWLYLAVKYRREIRRGWRRARYQVRPGYVAQVKLGQWVAALDAAAAKWAEGVRVVDVGPWQEREL